MSIQRWVQVGMRAARGRVATAVGIALMCGGGMPAQAVDMHSTVKLSISSQPLVSALAAFSEQAQIQVMSSSPGLAARKAPALSGSYSIEEALRLLLAGSGLEFKSVGPHTIAVVAPGVENQSPSAVSDGTTNTERGSTDAVDTVIVKGATINDPILSSRTGDRLRDRPQSVSIVTRERLDEQNITSVTSVLEQATGVTVTRNNFDVSRYYSRGFQISSMQLDGGAPVPMRSYSLLQSTDLSMYEQVEVLRGPDALFAGNGEPGGSVQLVRKRPTTDNRLSVEASGGSWNTYRGVFDASGPVGFDGRLRGRLVYSQDHATYYLKNGRNSKDQLYGVLEGDVAEGTQITVGGTFGHRENPHGATGLPRYSDGSDPHLPRDTVLSPTWARQFVEVGTAFIRLDQRLGDSWDLRANLMREREKSHDGVASSYLPIDLQTGLVPSTNTVQYDNSGGNQTLFDLTLKGKVDLFGFAQHIAVGVDSQQTFDDGSTWNLPDYTDINPFTYDPSAVPQPARARFPDFYLYQKYKQNGAYLSLTLQVAKPLKLMGGARYSNFEYTFYFQGIDNTNGSTSFASVTQYKDRGVVTPYAGFTFDLDKDWLLYGSFSESYESQASNLKGPLPGTPLDPVTGENFEVGVKGDLWRGHASTQLAIYQIDRKNDAVQDLRYPPQDGALGSSCCYLSQGTVRSRGFDFEINGNLLENWNLFLGYTFNENKYEAGYASGVGQSYMPQTPKHLLKLWTTVKLPNYPQLQFSGGVLAQTKNSIEGDALTYNSAGVVTGDAPYSFVAPGYAIFSARAAYDINSVWSLAANISNILDKTYYQTIGTTGYGNWYGDPRNFTVSIRGKW